MDVVLLENELYRNISSEMRVAKLALQDVEKNHFSIDGGRVDVPAIALGRNFEVRLPLDIESPARFNRLIRSLPKRFDPSIWRRYLGSLNRAFCEVFDLRYSRICISQISDNQCTYFHCDNVKIRLFQTLRGPGTEYLLEDNVRRQGIGSGNNAEIVIDQSQIQHARETDLFLMRGDLWYENRGLVHRSPPIEPRRLKRLYLCLDAMDDISDFRT